jgi:hypothetical protein
MKQLTTILLLLAVLAGALTLTGCFSGPNFTPSDSECLYKCGMCGKRVLMLNSLLRSQSCPEGGTHQWQRNL